MKINSAKYFIIVAWILLSFLNSCKKEAAKDNPIVEFNDYLPLTIGAKYKYKFSESYFHFSQGYIKRGECTWKFISKSAGTPITYQVEQSFKGDSVYYQDYGYGPVQIDTTHFENQISALSFEVQENGNVVFIFPVPYWHTGNETLVRFIQSERIDTCFISSSGLMNRWCLRKNIGITNLNLRSCANHCSIVSYSLIDGPYY